MLILGGLFVMSMIRTHKRENPFVQLDKHFIGNGELSLKATGLLTYFLSKPDDWQIYMKDVEKRFTDGETSIRSAMNELMKNGYVYRWRERNEKGQLGSYNYEVYERPEFNPHSDEEKEEHKKPKKVSKKKPKTKSKKVKSVGNKGVDPKRENPVLENPDLDNPVLENQALTNNESTNNDLTNNKKTNNLSIKESDIQELDIPISVQKQLILKKDRLIDDNISINDIENLYHSYQNKINDHEFALILSSVLESTRGQIKSIKHIMTKSISNYLGQPQQAENTQIHSGETSYPSDYSQYNFQDTGYPDWMDGEERADAFKNFMKWASD